MLGESLARLRTEARDDVEDAFGYAGFECELGETQTRERGLLGRL
jgi:hypothetical protein